MIGLCVTGGYTATRENVFHSRKIYVSPASNLPLATNGWRP